MNTVKYEFSLRDVDTVAAIEPGKYKPKAKYKSTNHHKPKKLPKPKAIVELFCDCNINT